MLKKLLLLILLGTAFTAQAEAAAPSTYRDIARLRAMNQRAQGIRPAADGKSYTTLRGNAIERHSYTKDAPGELLFEWKNDKENRDIADYQFSPDGKLLLLSIGSEPIYRHSYTTDYYLKDADGLRPILTDLARRTDDRLLERQQPLPLRHRRGFRASDHDRRCMEPDYQRYDRLGI